MFPGSHWFRQAARFHWRRADGVAELLLRDAFDDVNTDPAAWLWMSMDWYADFVEDFPMDFPIEY